MYCEHSWEKIVLLIFSISCVPHGLIRKHMVLSCVAIIHLKQQTLLSKQHSYFDCECSTYIERSTCCSHPSTVPPMCPSHLLVIWTVHYWAGQSVDLGWQNPTQSTESSVFLRCILPRTCLLLGMPNKRSVLANYDHQGGDIFRNWHHFKLSVSLR